MKHVYLRRVFFLAVALSLSASPVMAASFFDSLISKFDFLSSSKKDKKETSKESKESKKKARIQSNIHQLSTGKGIRISDHSGNLQAGLRLRRLTLEEFEGFFPEGEDRNAALQVEGTCHQNIERHEGEEGLPGPVTQTHQGISLADCIAIREHDVGQESCPFISYSYRFVFPEDQRPTPPERPIDRVAEVQLGEQECIYVQWLEEHENFRTAIFYNDWTPELQLSFFDDLRTLFSENFNFRTGFNNRRPWEGPEKSQEECIRWREPSFHFGGHVNDTGVLVDPGGCKDWRGTPRIYTDEELQRIWVQGAAWRLWFSRSGLVSWELPDDLETLQTIFPGIGWTDIGHVGSMRPLITGEPSHIYDVLVRSGILDPNNQRQTVVNLVRAIQQGVEAVNIPPFTHGCFQCDYYVPREIADRKMQAGEPILREDAINQEAPTFPVAFDPRPPDFELFMQAGIGYGCGGMTGEVFRALNFVNIPAKRRSYLHRPPYRSGHAFSDMILDSQRVIIGHGDSPYNASFKKLPPEAVLRGPRYFETADRIYDTPDYGDYAMDLDYCLALLHYLPERCRLNPDLPPFVPPDENFCRTVTFMNHINVYNGDGEFVRVEEAGEQTIELLTAEEHAQFRALIPQANEACQGVAEDS